MGPPWYQELSVPQIIAANELLESIQVDEAEHGFKCCFSVIQRLGLNPMLRKSKIKLLIHLARRSDLAFLWFMYQIYYKEGGIDREGGTLFFNFKLLFINML